jgi:hypothetical protein
MTLKALSHGFFLLVLACPIACTLLAPSHEELSGGGAHPGADFDASAESSAVEDTSQIDAADSMVQCPPGSKACAGHCVLKDEPSTGCGAPGCASCALAHASSMCDSAFQCRIEKCVLGFADCNSLDSDGCEADLNTSVSHCGECAKACAIAHASAKCVAADCQLDVCLAPFASCDADDANGCETDTSSDVANCGGCGKACPSANATATCNGGCSFVCAQGFGDCDKTASNGCEANLQSDPANCGQCGTQCGTKGACLKGACGCPSVVGTEVVGVPDFAYGFCFYLTAPGRTCDQACASLGGTNLAEQAATAFPDSCSAPGAADISTWFLQNGNPGSWGGTPVATLRRTLGHGYTAATYAGKCSAGAQPTAGTFPGNANDSPERNLVCACF